MGTDIAVKVIRNNFGVDNPAKLDIPITAPIFTPTSDNIKVMSNGNNATNITDANPVKNAVFILF